MEAVETVSGVRAPAFIPPSPTSRYKAMREAKPLALPLKAKYPSRLLSYLQGRGIGADVLRRCLDSGALYEGKYSGEAVCVFVGKDEGGTARFGCLRGINSELKRDCAGSDKRFSFRVTAKEAASGAVAVFEAPIDALSHATLYPGWGGHRLSLGGTSEVALRAFLEANPQTSHMSLCLDADEAGRTAAQRITESLGRDTRFSHIVVTADPPPVGKDYNEALLHAVSHKRAQKQAGHRLDAGLSI